MLLGLNTQRKMGLFTKYQRVSMETTDIHPHQPNLSKCDPMEVEPSNIKVQLHQQQRLSALGQLRMPRHPKNIGMFTLIILIRGQILFQQDYAISCMMRMKFEWTPTIISLKHKMMQSATANTSTPS